MVSFQDLNPCPTWQTYTELQDHLTGSMDMPEIMRDTTIQHYEPNDAFIQDTKTDKIYPNIDNHSIRKEAFGYLIKTPIWEGLMAVINIAIRLFRVITLYHFRSETPSPFKKTMLDLINIPLTPIGLVAMEIAALWAVTFNPKGGMKVYSSLEKLVFDKFYMLTLRPEFSPIEDESSNRTYVSRDDGQVVELPPTPSESGREGPDDIELNEFI